MAIKHFQYIRLSPMVGLEKIFKIVVLRRLENANLNFGFATNRTILFIFKLNLQEVC